MRPNKKHQETSNKHQIKKSKKQTPNKSTKKPSIKNQIKNQQTLVRRPRAAEALAKAQGLPKVEASKKNQKIRNKHQETKHQINKTKNQKTPVRGRLAEGGSTKKSTKHQALNKEN